MPRYKIIIPEFYGIYSHLTLSLVPLFLTFSHLSEEVGQYHVHLNWNSSGMHQECIRMQLNFDLQLE